MASNTAQYHAYTYTWPVSNANEDGNASSNTCGTFAAYTANMTGNVMRATDPCDAAWVVWYASAEKHVSAISVTSLHPPTFPAMIFPPSSAGGYGHTHKTLPAASNMPVDSNDVLAALMVHGGL